MKKLVKLIALFTALAMALLNPLYAFGLMGDVNADGVINAADGQLVFDYAAGKGDDLSYSAKQAADVDGDGEVTVGDAAQIIRYVNRTETKLPTNKLLRLSVLSMPHKTMYLPGESFDITGFKLAALYSGGQIKEINDYSYSGYSDSPGGKIITVGALGKMLSFTVTVDAPYPTSLSVSTSPTRRNYTVGTPLSLNGLVLTAHYESGATQKVDAYSVSGYDGKAGVKTVELSYMGAKTSFTVGCGYNATVNCGGTRINVRQGAGTLYSSLGTFNEGSGITVIDPAGENGWCYCFGKSSVGTYISGWCLKEYLIITP